MKLLSSGFTWLLLVLSASLLIGHSNFVAAEDELVEDEEDVKVADAPDGKKGDASSKDVEEEEEIKTPQPSPDVDVHVLFTQPTSPKEIPSRTATRFLVGFANNGDKEFNVMNLEASFRYPMDYSFHIQNFTSAFYNRPVGPKQEATLDYAFMPGDAYAGRPFGFVVTLSYRDAEGTIFQNTVFNDTIHVTEEGSDVNPETLFLYVFLGCVVILALLGGQQLLVKMRKKHGMIRRQAPVEMGTAASGDVDYDWIPKEILNHAKKSPQANGKTSPRPRKRTTQRNSGDD